MKDNEATSKMSKKSKTALALGAATLVGAAGIGITADVQDTRGEVVGIHEEYRGFFLGYADILEIELADGTIVELRRVVRDLDVGDKVKVRIAVNNLGMASYNVAKVR